MKIPAYRLCQKEKTPIYVMEFLRCPDGIYGICVSMFPQSSEDLVPQAYPISQIELSEDWVRQEEQLANRLQKRSKNLCE